MAKPIHLEGTTLEGGGQLLRLATCLSALTSTPVNITNIRGKRSGGGGLKAQHLTSVQWLSQVSNARVSGIGLKSKEITFTPNPTRDALVDEMGREAVIKQNTPGSVNLVFQAILPYIIFSGSRDPLRVRITGGTNVSNSPSCDYVEQVLLPMLTLIGIPEIKAQIHSRGWSQGGVRLGSVTYTVTPLKRRLLAFQLINRGDIVSVTATILAPKDCEQRFRDELDVMFEKREGKIFGKRDPEVDVRFEDSHHEKRFYLLLVATTATGIKLGCDWLYDHRVRAGSIDTVISSMVRKVSDDLMSEIKHGGCADEHLRDQLIVFQALARGQSTVYGGKRQDVLIEPSLHAKTAQWVAREVVDVQFDEHGSCNGIGFGAEDEPQHKIEAEVPVERLEETLVEVLAKLEVREATGTGHLKACEIDPRRQQG